MWFLTANDLLHISGFLYVKLVGVCYLDFFVQPPAAETGRGGGSPEHKHTAQSDSHLGGENHSLNISLLKCVLGGIGVHFRFM